MSALRNYRRSLSERRASVSEIYQQDAKRVSESSSTNWQAHSRTDCRRNYSSDEDEDVNECSQSQAKESKPKDRQRRFSLDFLFLRKSKTDVNKKKLRSQSTTDPATECGYSKYPRGTRAE